MRLFGLRCSILVAAVSLLAASCASTESGVDGEALPDSSEQTTTKRSDEGRLSGGEESDLSESIDRPGVTSSKQERSGVGGSFAVPAPGKYSYRVRSRDADGESKASQAVLVVRDRGRDATGVRQEHEQVSGEVTTVAARLWTPEGGYLTAMTTIIEGNAYSCQLHEAVLTLKLPFAVGEKWRSRGVCAAGELAGEHVEYRGQVVGRESFKVDGEEIGVYVVHEEQFGRLGSSETRYLFSPTHGLSLHAETSATAEDFGGTTTHEITIESARPTQVSS